MKNSVLIVDDEEDLRNALAELFRTEGCTAFAASSGKEALELMAGKNIDVVLSDIMMPDMDGIELLRRIGQWHPRTSVMIMTAFASAETAIQALRHGAFDYILKPLHFDELLMRVSHLWRHNKLEAENAALRRQLTDAAPFSRIVGESAPMRAVFSLINKVAPTRSNVLVTGRSGTGKELVARAIHAKSDRHGVLFLPINCGAISESLIESEMFGHMRGAFTDAVQDKLGVFQLADGGTLFLDEIAEIPMHLQVKLLRVLDEHKVTPVGGTTPIPVDVRIVSATNKDLFQCVQEGKFREDLYYRLNVFEIRLPALNERREDIPLLIQHFLSKYSAEMHKSILGVDHDAMHLLVHHEWRGGVRELENVIERAVIFCDEGVITRNELPDSIGEPGGIAEMPEPLREAGRLFERNHIVAALNRYGWNKEISAKALDIGLSSLYRKMEELDIKPGRNG
jgi:DNA-binding NtrC family response regulator